MKKIYFLYLLIITFNSISQESKNVTSPVVNNTETKESHKKTDEQKITDLKEIIKLEEKFEAKPLTLPKQEKKQPCKTILLNFENEDLTNVINQVAGLKCINIIFPQPPSKFNVKFNFTSSEEVSVDKAWNLIQTIIDLAGYSIVKKGEIYQIVPNTAMKEPVTRETLPIYVDVVDAIPNTDEKIRFIYFFDNISIQNPSNPSFNNLDQILKDMLINEPEQSYLLDSPSNSLIISAKASVIKGIMRIIEELDKTGFREAIEVIPLLHTRANFIADILSKLIPSEEQFRFGYPKLPRTAAQYFSEATKVVPIERTNSIAILGTPESVQRVKDFIEKNLDQAIESGRSVIHIKKLEYLNAKDLAGPLQELVKARSDQAEADIKDGLANAIIVAEEQTAAPALVPTAAPGVTAPATAAQPSGAIMGGNNLIVAARSIDWKSIELLIDSIDKPQLQVALDILITEITVKEEQALGAQTRNITNPDNNELKFQTANMTIPWLNFLTKDKDGNSTGINTVRGIASNFDQFQTQTNAATKTQSTFNIASSLAPGNTVLTFKDGNGISHIAHLLDTYQAGTILSHPYVVTRNHKQANVSVIDTHYVSGAVKAESTGGPVILANDFIKADLTVNILPRVAAKGDITNGEINLEISVSSNSFSSTSPTATTRFTRKLNTNSNVNNNEVLVIGGLVRTDTTENQNETPPLSRIPIIGYLFKDRDRVIAKTMLVIFIKPTIIKPRLEGALNDYSKDKIDFLKADLRDSEEFIIGRNFENLKDPITRFFFPSSSDARDESINYYSTQAIYALDPTEKNEVVKPIEPRPKEIKQKEKIAKQKEETKKIIKENPKQIKDLIKDDKNPLITH